MLSVPTIFMLIGLSGLLTFSGFVVGWWLRSTRRTADGASDILTRRMAEALARLQTIAGDISLDASQHAEEVEAVNRRLGSADTDVESLHRALLEGMTQIITSNGRLQNHLTEVETRLEEQARQIDAQLVEARLDSLTGTANRRSFDEELNRRVAEWRRRQTPISLMMIDVDHFKRINDKFGHPAGDAVLREIARVMQATMREMDFVARYGGEEFVVILPSTTLRDARRAGERILEAIAGHRFSTETCDLDVTVSVGLAQAMPGDDSATLLRRADEALYLSKAAGRNCGHFHSGADCIALDSPRLIEVEETAAPVVQQSAMPRAAAIAAETTSQSVDGIDALTDLPTASAFSTELRRRVQRCKPGGAGLTLLLVDIDRLTRINSQIGRDAGDFLLRHTADVLRRECREVDYLARYHQGQFALVLDGVDVNEALRMAEHIRCRVQDAPPIAGDLRPEVSVSCGVAPLRNGDRAVSLVMRAGVALSAAKSAGRDCVFVHDGQTAEPADCTEIKA